MKWRSRESVEDRKTGPKTPRSTVLSPQKEALCVAFRKHTLFPLDDCLYTLQATSPRQPQTFEKRSTPENECGLMPSSTGARGLTSITD